MTAADGGGFGRWAGRWSTRGARLVLGVLLSALALVLSWAALLNIVIRDVPEPSSVAEDLVVDLAVAIGADPAQAEEIAAEAVASIDGTYLNGSLGTADDIRLGILALPWILLVLIALVLLVTPAGWRRRRWLGWALMLAGGGLLLLAAVLDVEARDAAGAAPPAALETARELVGRLLAPAWPIGFAAVAAGLTLWAWGIVVLVRDRREPAPS